MKKSFPKPFFYEVHDLHYSQISNKRIGSNEWVGYKYTERNKCIDRKIVIRVLKEYFFLKASNKRVYLFIRDIRVFKVGGIIFHFLIKDQYVYLEV